MGSNGNNQESTGTYGQDCPIAIIGYGVRFPGDATSPEKFYEMLSEGRDAWTETPPNRYNVDAYWHPSTDRIGTTSARGAHYVAQDPAVFDAPFFSMTGAEAGALDPALRMMLEVVYECLEDSGIPMQSVIGSDTSVFCGTSSSEYRDLMLSDIEDVPLYSAVGVGVCMLANRLSHFYDLRGSSQTIDTACSATMVAMHQACQSLRTGEARMSLVAGSQLMMGAGGNVSLTRLGFLSPNGRCFTFDERADGYSRGEGTGCLALKRLDDAIADGDTIRAVVRATGSNQDGKTPGIVQPSAQAQSDLIKQVYRAAKLNPDDTQYFEAHGTGTTLGDPLEVNALVSAMDTKNRSEDNPMYIGSVKTNVGHLEGSAGLAGLFKAILQLEHGQIFPTLNFKKVNPRLKLDDWHLKLPLECLPWPTTGQRRISINSFGYGGTNAHCILDDAYNYLKERNLKGMTATIPFPPGLSRRSYDSNSDSAMGSETITPENEVESQLPKLFVFSSPEKDAVDRMTTRYADWLEKESKSIGKEEINLGDLAYTLGLRRSTFQWRLPVIAQTATDLQEALAKESKSTRASGVPNLLWVFTGQGAQHAAMGKELLHYEVFRQNIEAARLFFRETLKAEWDVLEELTKNNEKTRINEAEFSQPLCTVVQVALVELLTSWKIAPQAVVGHSSGEIAAAYAAGALSAADAWTVAFHRGRLSASIPEQAPELEGSMGMMAVGKPAEEIVDKIPGAEADEPVVAACFNSPANVTLSGNKQALSELEKQFKEEDIFARQLKVDIAYHSPYMKVIADQYRDAIKDIKPLKGNKDVTMLSTVTGSQVENTEDLGADYWVQNMCSPVRFVEGIQAAFPKQKTLSRRKKRDGLSIDGMLEIGPHSALQGPIRQILTEEKKAEQVFYASMLVRGKSAVQTALETAGMLWSKGLPMDFERINNTLIEPPRGKVLAGLPNYSWNHSNAFWFEHAANSRRKRTGFRHDLVGARLEPHVGISWRNWLRPKENPWLSDFKIEESIVLTPQTLLVSIIEAGRQMSEGAEVCHGFTLSNVKFGTPVVLPELGTDIYTGLRPVEKIEEGRVSVFEFDIFTNPEEVPVYHAQGQLRIHYEDAPLHNETVGTNGAEKKPEEFYSHWADEEIHWGPQNQLITSLQAAENSSKATLELKETKKAMPLEYEYAHLVHPTTLNACFQGLFAAMGDDAAYPETRGVESVYISNTMPQGKGVTLTANSILEYKGYGSYAGEVTVKDKAGKVQVLAQGVNLQKSKAAMLKNVAPEKAPADVKKVVSNFYWKPDVAKITPEQAKTVFNEKDLILSSPERPVFEGTGALPHLQKSAVPDVMPWKAFTAKWLELMGHKEPTQVIVEVARSADDFAPKALETLGGKFGATPVCSKYLCATQEALPEGSIQFQPWAHFFEPKARDLKTESNVTEPEPASVDTFIVTDRIPGLNDAEVLLNNAASALKAGGWLVMSQVGVPDSKADMEAVSLQLQRAGFDGVRFSLPSDSQHSNTRVLITQKPASPTMAADEAVFVLPEEVSEDLQKHTELLKEALSKMDVKVSSVSWNNLAKDLSLIKGKAVVNFLEAENPFIYEMNQEQYESMKAFLLTASKGGVWVHRGNCNLIPEADPRFHATTGMLRVMRNEEQDNKFSELSLSYREPLARAAAIEHVVSVFRDVFEAESLEGVAESEIGELDGVLRISRIYDEPIKNRKMEMVGKQPPPRMAALSQNDRPMRLIVDDADAVDLKFIDDSTNQSKLGEPQIQVDVQAHAVRSLNDIKNSLGLTEKEIGTSAAGIVKAVGSKVSNIKTGDQVAFFTAGAWKTQIQLNEDAVVKIPDNLAASTAATFISNLMVAYYTVFELCRVRPLDTILVTSAETGLGNLIVQLSKHLGANIFLMASDEECKLKAIDTFGLQPEQVIATNGQAFAKNIRKTLSGKNVDFVFKTCKNKSAAAADVATKSISKLGQVFDTERFDQIEGFLAKDQSLVNHVAKQANGLVSQGMVQPLEPAQVFGYSDMKAAFEAAALQQGNPDIALELRSTDDVPVVPGLSHELECKEDATYVLVGGLGGVGRWLALQLAERGAKHIATLSRSGAKKQEAKDTLKQLADMGVNCKAYCCDIGDATSFKDTLKAMESEGMPPVKGAVHAAMALWDSYLKELPFEGWDMVTRNKVQGGLNMHNFLPKDMDFLVFISSLSVVMGQAMQANYASGNCFLDGLAYHRRNLGMNCSVVNFGLIAGIGFVAELQTFDAKDADYEKYSIPPHEVWSVLQSAMTGYIDKDVPTGPQQLTCCMSGGMFQTLTTLQTFIHLGDPKFKFINHLDRKGGEDGDDSVSKIRKGRKALENALKGAATLDAASAIVETQLIEKIAAAIPMPPEDVDPSKPCGSYGVDSLIASEVRNWAFNVVKGVLHAAEILSAPSINDLATKLASRSDLVPEELKK